jgi:hypothetical protein
MLSGAVGGRFFRSAKPLRRKDEALEARPVLRPRTKRADRWGGFAVPSFGGSFRVISNR